MIVQSFQKSQTHSFSHTILSYTTVPCQNMVLAWLSQYLWHPYCLYIKWPIVDRTSTHMTCPSVTHLLTAGLSPLWFNTLTARRVVSHVCHMTCVSSRVVMWCCVTRRARPHSTGHPIMPMQPLPQPFWLVNGCGVSGGSEDTLNNLNSVRV